jgi:nucleotide-binding universal stress UspA family protein
MVEHEQPKDVLVATDFSPHSERALRVGVAYARALGARLHVLHVSDEPDAVVRTESWVHQVMPALGAIVVVEGGQPAASIVRYAKEHGVALIVVGTHGRTGFTRALLGSVAEMVSRTAPCPVLTVPPGVATEPATDDPVGAPLERCLVCGLEAEELICTSCRARIRGEALERKRQAERTRSR